MTSEIPSGAVPSGRAGLRYKETLLRGRAPITPPEGLPDDMDAMPNGALAPPPERGADGRFPPAKRHTQPDPCLPENAQATPENVRATDAPPGAEADLAEAGGPP